MIEHLKFAISVFTINFLLIFSCTDYDVFLCKYYCHYTGSVLFDRLKWKPRSKEITDHLINCYHNCSRHHPAHPIGFPDQVAKKVGAQYVYSYRNLKKCNEYCFSTGSLLFTRNDWLKTFKNRGIYTIICNINCARLFAIKPFIVPALDLVKESDRSDNDDDYRTSTDLTFTEPWPEGDYFIYTENYYA